MIGLGAGFGCGQVYERYNDALVELSGGSVTHTNRVADWAKDTFSDPAAAWAKIKAKVMPGSKKEGEAKPSSDSTDRA